MSIHTPLHYSSKDIKQFIGCQFRYYYNNVVPRTYKKTLERDQKEGGGARLPSHVGNLFHYTANIIHRQYLNDFPVPSWVTVESIFDGEWKRYKQKHEEEALRNDKNPTLRDEHKIVTLQCLKEYHTIYWTSPVEKVVASELNCSWNEIEKRRQALQLSRGNRDEREKYFRQFSVPIKGFLVALTGAVDYVYKSSDHRRIGVCDFKTVFSSNRKEVERQFESQVKETKFQLGLYSIFLSHWLDPEVMLEGTLNESCVRLISPSGVQSRTFNREEVQESKNLVVGILNSIVEQTNKYHLKPEKWKQQKCDTCDRCPALRFCKTANPNAETLNADQDWETNIRKKMNDAFLDDDSATSIWKRRLGSRG